MWEVTFKLKPHIEKPEMATTEDYEETNWIAP